MIRRRSGRPARTWVSRGELHRRVDGLRARSGEEDASVGNRRQRGDPLGERVRWRVRERVEARVGLDRRDLGGYGIGDLGSAMADLAVPEARHCVDELVAVGIPQQRTIASCNGDEPLSSRLRERVEESTGHVGILPVDDGRAGSRPPHHAGVCGNVAPCRHRSQMPQPVSAPGAIIMSKQVRSLRR